MRKANHLILLLTILTATLTMTGCNSSRPVTGALEASVGSDYIPASVLKSFSRAATFHQYEIMSDSLNDVSVWGITEADTTYTEGYGISVMKGNTSTIFANICNTRQPWAMFDKAGNCLWLASCAMGGTGVQVEKLYKIRFHDNDSAYVAAVLDPYAMQQALCHRLRYSVNGRQINLYDAKQPLATFTIHDTEMGALLKDAVWIGEQLSYTMENGVLSVNIAPGISFATTRVFFYDDTPTLKARVTLNNDGTFTLGSISSLQSTTIPY